MKIAKKDFLVSSLFLLLILFFFSRFLSGTNIIAFKDLSRYFYPLRYLMVEQVKAGHFPLWNPYIFCGFPLLATLQVCFFYPLTLIFYLLPYNLAFNYYFILHYFLAANFMYWLLRYFKLSRAASFLGGVIFAFSGYLLSVSNMNTSLSSAIWLPLTVLFFDRMIRKTDFFNITVLAILIALQFLGGEPTIIYITCFFLFIYGLVFSPTKLKSTLGLALAGLIALGIVAVQLLPFIELSRLSDRIVRTSYDIVTFRSFPPRELLTFIFPYFFGNPAQFGGYTETLLGKVYQDWLISPYLGILPLILVWLAFRKNRSFSWFLSGTVAVSLFLAFGKYTPFYRIIFLIPGISMIRYPVKYLFLTTFCLTILASFGFQWLLDIFDEQRAKFLGVIKGALSVFVILSLIFIPLYAFRLKIYEFFANKYANNIPPYFFDLLASIISFNLTSLLFVILYLLGFSLILWMAYKGKIKRIIFVFLIIVMVIADLFANGYNIIIAAKAKIYETDTANYQILKKEKGLYRFFYTPEQERASRVIYGGNYNDALINAKDNLAANWHIPSHLFDFYGYESVKPMIFFNYYQSNLKKDKLIKNLKYLSLFNVKYVSSMEELKAPYLKLLRHKYKYGSNYYLYENKKVLPRAYVLGKNNKPDLFNSSVKIVGYQPNQVNLKVVLQNKGILFLSDAYYPGWKVFVDGREGQLLRVNELFRGVELAPGKHRVKFVYDPFSFKLGGLISLLTVAGLIIGGIYYSRKKQ